MGSQNFPPRVRGEDVNCLFTEKTLCAPCSVSNDHVSDQTSENKNSVEKQPVKHQQLQFKTKQTKPMWRSMHVSLVSQINGSLRKRNPCYVGPQ